MSDQSQPIEGDSSKPVKNYVMYNKVKIFKGTPEYEAHIKKQKEWRDQWYKNNPEKLKKIHKDGWANNKERRKQSMYKWRDKNKDEYLEYRRDWTQENSERINQQNRAIYDDPSTGRKARILHQQRAREARKTDLTIGNEDLIVDWMKRWNEMDAVTCFWCLRLFHPKQCSHDHIIAITLNGPHCIENLCIACKSCNSSKRNLGLSDWNKKLKQPILEWQNNFI